MRDIFNLEVNSFESGIKALYSGNTGDAKRLLTQASQAANQMSELNTDEGLKKSWKELSLMIDDLIETAINEGGDLSEVEPAIPLINIHKDVFNKGMEAFYNKDYDTARTLMFQASDFASRIAKVAANKKIGSEYGKLSGTILEFIDKSITPKSKGANETVHIEEGSFGNNKISFNEIKKEDKTVTFRDVVGLNDVKEEILYKVLKPLENPKLANQYKIEPGSKMLLYGPPGTGKTHVARAIAGEVDAKFYVINCHDLIDKWVGESSKRIEALFNQIANDERAVIFFDEFDAIAAKRSESGGDGDSEVSRMVSTLLTKIDGFKKTNKNKMLLIVAATNRPKAIDPAVLRGGRIDTQIYVGLPDQQARKIMVERAFSEVPLVEGFSSDAVAKALEGYGGGDIKSICEKIRLEAFKKASKTGEMAKVTAEDCIKGIKKQRNVITPAMLKEFEEYKMGHGANTTQQQ